MAQLSRAAPSHGSSDDNATLRLVMQASRKRSRQQAEAGLVISLRMCTGHRSVRAGQAGQGLWDDLDVMPGATGPLGYLVDMGKSGISAGEPPRIWDKSSGQDGNVKASGTQVRRGFERDCALISKYSTVEHSTVESRVEHRMNGIANTIRQVERQWQIWACIQRARKEREALWIRELTQT